MTAALAEGRSAIDVSRAVRDDRFDMLLRDLRRFAETLLPLLDQDLDTAVARAEHSLEGFATRFQMGFLKTFSSKLGLASEDPTSKVFIESTLETLAKQEVDFTLFFRHLTRISKGEDSSEFLDLWKSQSLALEWLEDWCKLAQSEARLDTMLSANPIRIPRNHQVERAIQAGYSGDFAPFNRLVDALQEPFAERSEYSELEAAACPEERVTETFCGT